MADKAYYHHFGPLPLTELLAGLSLGGPVSAFADHMVADAAPAGKAKAGEISYIEGRGGAKILEGSQAGFCLVDAANLDAVQAAGLTPILSDAPRADFARVLARLYTPRGYDGAGQSSVDGVQICAGAVIADSARIGTGSLIGPNAVIGPGVRIGQNCRIGANVVIECTQMGDDCTVHHGAVIGSAGFGVAADKTGTVDIPHIGGVILGNHVSIGSQTTIDRAMFGNTQIGDGCKFDNQVQIAHNCEIGKNCMFAAHVGISGSCRIGNGVVMGGKAGLADHLTVGDGAMMAAHASAMHNVPAGETWSGVPARPIRLHMKEIAMLRKMVNPKPGAKT